MSTSGAAHCTEPTRDMAATSRNSRESPKSLTLTPNSAPTSRLCDLRSR